VWVSGSISLLHSSACLLLSFYYWGLGAMCRESLAIRHDVPECTTSY
jgi:hypothetical protein